MSLAYISLIISSYFTRRQGTSSQVLAQFSRNIATSSPGELI